MHITRLRNILSTLALAALAACGGGESATTGASAGGGTVGTQSTGTALVSLTDAPGDFVSYIVNVTSIKLTRADGTSVETLPATTQVDFAQLVNLSEVISAAQVPAGSYAAVALTLDFNGATLVLDNGGSGITVPAANILNGSATGTPPLVSPNSQVTLNLQLPSGQPLVVSNGTVSHLALDFDLAVSNAVSPATLTSSTAASSVTVTVNPTLSASLAPDATKSLNLRGALASVSASGSSYTINVRPFFKVSGSNGNLVVQTTSTTVFQINGVSSTGAAGLTALAAVASGTLTLASGSYDVSSHTFTAATVYAGTSIPGAGLDSVDGTVVARSGSVLTLANGLVCDRGKDGVSFGRSVAVTVGSGTAVTKAGMTGSFTAQDISVGQHLQLFGTLGTDTSGNRTLDATAGSARLQVTGLWGLFASSASGVVTLNLQALDGRSPSAFTFAGTGSSSANDATAAAYTVAVPATLSVGSVGAGTALRFTGFVNAFGAAPPAFSAQSIVSYAATSARLGIAFPTPAGSTAPFVTPVGTTLVLSQATLQATDRSSLAIGPQLTNLKTTAPTTGLTLQANAAGSSGHFAVAHWKSRKSDSFSSFADLVTGLKTDLNGTTAVLGIGADGPYDATTGTLSANDVYVVLND